ncbi:hypothetical protein SDC9_123057 [bioreactor metagenome]|uniref:Uncharacterized protein n=1 Tax=bioreactor metagenome TaxID=1076179 RepID=A0A645CGS4_9ZZZZ
MPDHDPVRRSQPHPVAGSDAESVIERLEVLQNQTAPQLIGRVDVGLSQILLHLPGIAGAPDLRRGGVQRLIVRLGTLSLHFRNAGHGAQVRNVLRKSQRPVTGDPGRGLLLVV